MNRTLSTTLTLSLLMGVGLGCRKPKVIDKIHGQTAPELLAKGESLMRKGKWEQGRADLRLIEEYLPATPEFPKAKLLLADSYFFGSTNNYPEAQVEYQSFLNYFPRSEKRDYALYHIGLCHYASIESADRDQAETKKALETFQQLLKESPGSTYSEQAKSKVTQCWRRIAEHELLVGVFYVNTYNYPAAESRLKGLLQTYPEYVDRERAYFFLGEALRKKLVSQEVLAQFNKEFLAKFQKKDFAELTPSDLARYKLDFDKFSKEEIVKYRLEGKGFYQKLVESYTTGEWAMRARERLVEMGQRDFKEELDS